MCPPVQIRTGHIPRSGTSPATTPRWTKRPRSCRADALFGHFQQTRRIPASWSVHSWVQPARTARLPACMPAA
eukprot:2056902-Rhodomonas_salina.1